MAIILEGPDAAGKSTLAKHICDIYGFKFYSSGGAPKNEVQENMFLSEQYLLAEIRHQVIDRVTAISQQVYANRLFDSKLVAALQSIQATKSVIIYCRPPIDALMKPEKHQWKDYDTEEHKQFVLDNQHVLIKRYDDLMYTIPHIVYDYTDEDNFENLLTLIIDSQDSDEGYKHLMEVIHESQCRSFA